MNRKLILLLLVICVLFMMSKTEMSTVEQLLSMMTASTSQIMKDLKM